MLQRTLCKQAEVDAGGTRCHGNRSWLFRISCSGLSLLLRPHAVHAPVPSCRRPVLWRRRPRVILSKALCCPASNNQWHPSSVSSLTRVWAHKSQYSASASWELLYCAQISNHRHPSAVVLPQPSSSNTPYASGIRSQTLLRPDLHGILDLLALHPLPDHGCFLFLHPSSPHQRPCLLARSGCEPRFSLFDPSRSTSYLDCWLVISPCPAR